MSPSPIRCVALLLVTALLPATLLGQDSELLPLRYQADTGKLLLEVRQLDQPMIYTNTLAAGVGTTSPLLDRGQIGVNALVRFERHGSKVMLIQDNDGHTALDGSDAERLAVHESFPRSVLAAMPIVEERADGLVVDATEFVLSDLFGVTDQIKRTGDGQAQLDRDRSHVVSQWTGSFATNTEIRAALTFAVSEPSRNLQLHTPDARSMTIEQHHSFIALPDDDYRPRQFHPQAGVFPHILFDFNQAHDTDYRQRWVWRWRLVPSDPDAYLAGELVEPEQPIVYYLDPAIPEPYRSAFREGGEWWNQGFEAAGFKNAFQIRDLPEDVNPMDARYSVIHWVHRRERGPSVGPHYRDPRTGEIIRTIVRMDSFRSLVNHDIWMGFLPAAGAEGLALDSEEMAMARRRQHSAHEIGHTLGMAHNFIAATHDRASVMDYPVPLLSMDDNGQLDLSAAYDTALGEFDIMAIRYTYTWFPDEQSEREGLAAIIDEFHQRNLRFITGGDAGPAGSMPDATTWVEGNDMFAATERTMAVRERLIGHFDERAIRPGEPYFLLNKRFAHVYFHHRTALVGLTKHIGGMNYRYAMAGEQTPPTEIIAPEEQHRALASLVAALSPDALAVPERVSALIAPQPFGWNPGWGWHVDEQLIDSPGGPMFDPIHLAHSLAQELIDNLFHPQRMARVASQAARDGDQPGVAGVLDAVIDATWGREFDEGQEALVLVTRRAALDALLDLAGSEHATAFVRAAAEARIRNLDRRIAARQDARRASPTPMESALNDTARRDIARYFDGRDRAELRPRPEPIALPWP